MNNSHPNQTRLISKLRVIGVKGQSHRAMLQAGCVIMPCAIGRNGRTHRKREGDGATPAGRLKLLGGYFRKDRLSLAGGRQQLKPTSPADGWCDAPVSARYNRAVKLPFPDSHETMFRMDHVYDVVIDLDFNHCPRVKGLGSAIFFHLTHLDRRATAGCVAIEPAAMRRLLPRLARHCWMLIR